MDEKKDVRSVVLGAAAEAGGDPGDHRSFDVLSAYRANELSPEEADRVQEHLSRCDACAARLLDLAVFEDEEAEVDDLEFERELRRLELRLAHDRTEGGGSPEAPAGAAAAPAAGRGRDRRIWARAASLLLAFGLGAFLAGLVLVRPHAPSPFPGPAAPPLVAELVPERAGPTRSPGGADEPLRVPRGRAVSLVLHQVYDDGARHLARVAPPDGEPFTAPLEPGPTGLLVLTLPADAPAGRYRIELAETDAPGAPGTVFRFDLAHE